MILSDGSAEEVVELDRTPTGKEEFDFFSSEEERGRKLRNDSEEQDMGHRAKFAEHAYKITEAWVGFLILISIGQFACKPIGLGLGTTEFVTVVTTTTASVFGFWLLVGRYLFHRSGN